MTDTTRLARELLGLLTPRVSTASGYNQSWQGSAGNDLALAVGSVFKSAIGNQEKSLRRLSIRLLAFKSEASNVPMSTERSMRSLPSVKRDSTTPELQESKAAIPAFGLPMPRLIPRRYKPRNVGEWSGHLGFASDLIVAIKPELIVELGTHWGEAYFTFCQTVEEHGLSSLCYAVDHWLGDEHAGRYGEEVFDDVKQYNDRYYRQFSYLLRTSFDDAVSQFGDGSIGLLHIDGLHTYEAVSHDFRTWLPKVKPGGIVLLHDICPKHQDFGVWRLWEEIRAEFPSTFEFHHSWGLGVVRKEGEAENSGLTEFLFSGSPSLDEEVRRHYVVYASHLEHVLGHFPAGAAAPEIAGQVSPGIRVKIFPFGPSGYSEDTAVIHKAIAGEWTTLVFELPKGNGAGPLRVDPEHQPCLVEVGDILVHSHLSGELLWSDNASSGVRGFVAAGSAAVLPIGNGSVVTSFGDDPQLIFATPPDMQGRLTITLTLRVSLAPNPAPEIVHRLVKNMQASAEEQVSAERSERDTIANKLELKASELAHVTSELADAKADLGRVTTELGRMTAESSGVKTELGYVRTELGQVTTARNEMQQALTRTQELLLTADDRLRSMQGSLSWRATEPIRKLMNFLRSGPRKTW